MYERGVDLQWPWPASAGSSILVPGQTLRSGSDREGARAVVSDRSWPFGFEGMNSHKEGKW